jgi:pentatricopeptide repeat protein
VQACARSIRPLRVAEILQDMMRMNLVPDRTTYNSMLHACSNARRPDLARLVLQAMRQRALMMRDSEINPDAWSYTAALTAVARRARADSEVAQGPVSRLTEHLKAAMPFGTEDAAQWAELLDMENEESEPPIGKPETGDSDKV